MKIQNNLAINKGVKLNNLKPSKQQNFEKSLSLSNFKNYDKSYYINFTSRRPKEMVEVMPITVKNAYSKIENKEDEFCRELKNNAGALQIYAFSRLSDCHSVDEIKKEFKDEPCLNKMISIADYNESGKNALLEKLKEIHQQGYRYSLVTENGETKLKISNIKEGSEGDELSTFLAKAFFLNCRTFTELSEYINQILKYNNQEAMSVGRFRRVITDPLGIDFPNGRTYGPTIRYSANADFIEKCKKCSEQLNVSKVKSPEAINEICTSAFSQDEKQKYIMIDAWNNCIDLRKDLSDFLHVNYSNPNFDKEVDTLDIESIYKYAKMQNLMKTFWQEHPQYCKDLSYEIEKAEERYTKKEQEAKLNPQILEDYKKLIKQKNDEIKNQIKLEQDTFEEGKNCILQIANKTVGRFAFPELVLKDYSDLLLEQATNYELFVFDKMKVSDKEFRETYDVWRIEKLPNLKNNAKYLDIVDAQNFAIISILDEKGIDLSDLNLEDKKAVKVKLLQILPSLSSSDIELIKKKYANFKQRLTSDQLKQIEETLVDELKGDVEFDKEEIELIRKFLKTKGKYMTLINDKRNAIAKMFAKELSKLNEDSLNIEEKIKAIHDKRKIIEDIDLSDIVD